MEFKNNNLLMSFMIKTYIKIKLLLSLPASTNVIEADSKDNSIYIMKMIAKLKLLLDKWLKKDEQK